MIKPIKYIHGNIGKNKSFVWTGSRVNFLRIGRPIFNENVWRPSALWLQLTWPGLKKIDPISMSRCYKPGSFWASDNKAF
jgi:hypothetical protein